MSKAIANRIQLTSFIFLRNFCIKCFFQIDSFQIKLQFKSGAPFNFDLIFFCNNEEAQTRELDEILKKKRSDNEAWMYL